VALISAVRSAVLLLAVAPAAASAQRDSPSPPPLEFLGFVAGAPLDQVANQVRELGGERLHCDRARADKSVSECRATLADPYSGRPISLWLSAMDGHTGVLTLSGPMASDQLGSWLSDLSRTYGMMQWVRRGRMLRLTWRTDHGTRTASVSRVDGRVLDDWGRRRGS